jgi:hypothetical protein
MYLKIVPVFGLLINCERVSPGIELEIGIGLLRRSAKGWHCAIALMLYLILLPFPFISELMQLSFIRAKIMKQG